MKMLWTHQNILGLTISKSDESLDSPWKNPSENPDPGITLLFNKKKVIVDNRRIKVVKCLQKTDTWKLKTANLLDVFDIK